tara:strand:- start:81 stop:644 length:564 start_codon:yes stop_codon:yes gene_type:complete
MADKIYITYEDIHKDTELLYTKLKAMSCIPDYIVAIGTGGFVPARIIKTFFNDIPIICINISYYHEEHILHFHPKEIQTIHINSPEHVMIKHKNILIIDDLDDTRTTLSYISEYLLTLEPNSITIGVLHNKRKKKLKQLNDTINYVSAKNVDDIWIVYPWESKNITKHNKLRDPFWEIQNILCEVNI